MKNNKKISKAITAKKPQASTKNANSISLKKSKDFKKNVKNQKNSKKTKPQPKDIEKLDENLQKPMDIDENEELENSEEVCMKEKEENNIKNEESELEEDDDEDDAPPRVRSKVDEFDDIKNILADEFGNRIKKQIDKINDQEKEEENKKKEKVVNEKKVNQIALIREKISNIQKCCPNLEKDLVMELLKCDENVIFVGNVPSSLKDRDLKKLFSKFGVIESLRLRGFLGQKNLDKKLAYLKHKVEENQFLFAYISYKEIESANKACEWNGKKLGDHVFRITKAYDIRDQKLHKIVLRNLPYKPTFPEVRAMIANFLSGCGEMAKVKAFKEKPSDQQLSIALISFESQDAVQLALLKNGTNIDKHTIKVELYNENMKLGYREQRATLDPKTNKPIHKKKELKKRLKLAKTNAQKQKQPFKVSLSKKKNSHIKFN